MARPNLAYVHTLDRAAVEEAVSELGLKYRIDRDGDVHIPWSEDADWGTELDMYVRTQGDILVTFFCFAARRIPRAKFSRALLLVNEWNRSHLWPKAYFMDDPDAGDGGIVCDMVYPVPRGYAEGSLRTMIDLAIDGSRDFWTWACTEQGIWR